MLKPNALSVIFNEAIGYNFYNFFKFYNFIMN